VDSLVESLPFFKMNNVFILNILVPCFTIAMSVQLRNGYYFIPQTASLWYEMMMMIIIIIIMGRNIIVGIATCYGLDSPGIESSLQYRGYCFLLGLKRPGRDVDHPPSSSAKVKDRVELYIYPSPLGLHGLL
jgi:hypothetical protein